MIKRLRPTGTLVQIGHPDAMRGRGQRVNSVFTAELQTSSGDVRSPGRQRQPGFWARCRGCIGGGRNRLLVCSYGPGAPRAGRGHRTAGARTGVGGDSGIGGANRPEIEPSGRGFAIIPAAPPTSYVSSGPSGERSGGWGERCSAGSRRRSPGQCAHPTSLRSRLRRWRRAPLTRGRAISVTRESMGDGAAPPLRLGAPLRVDISSRSSARSTNGSPGMKGEGASALPHRAWWLDAHCGYFRASRGREGFALD